MTTVSVTSFNFFSARLCRVSLCIAQGRTEQNAEGLRQTVPKPSNNNNNNNRIVKYRYNITRMPLPYICGEPLAAT